jgi:hypothetical protein
MNYAEMTVKELRKLATEDERALAHLQGTPAKARKADLIAALEAANAPKKGRRPKPLAAVRPRVPSLAGEPVYDASLSLEENVYVMREAGVRWNRLEKLLGIAHGGQALRAYDRVCEAKGQPRKDFRKAENKNRDVADLGPLATGAPAKAPTKAKKAPAKKATRKRATTKAKAPAKKATTKATKATKATRKRAPRRKEEAKAA